MEVRHMSTTMTRQEQQEFLAALHVGVLSIADKERGPLTILLWHAYEPGGELRFVTSRNSRKGQLLRAGCRVSVCVQDEQPPYKYVSVEGPVIAVEKSEVERDVRPLASRYLGRERGDRFITMTGGAEAREENMLVRIQPERWFSADYAKAFDF